MELIAFVFCVAMIAAILLGTVGGVVAGLLASRYPPRPGRGTRHTGPR